MQTAGNDKVLTLGFISLAIMGGFYYLVPRVSGKSLSWPGLVNWIFWISAISTALMAAVMIIAGISGGQAFQSGVKAGALDAVLAPYMIAISLISIVGGLTAALFAVQMIHTAAKSSLNAVESQQPAYSKSA